ncbi:putative BsuMI modification methylase subunit YdiO [Methylobacterium hispanicum]|uniref:DNA (cytosine-5-)-methyltransferase n=2 Tax=Methylobacterium hispanicum TaxID=270350 RepID=A0AAV4ZRM7_9HYPH|nr:putative BsuMI modification methylase subunit YdiO [Methylobacterium hispanicum]
MTPAAAVDIDAGALATYARNFPEARTFAADIRGVAVDEIASALAPASRSALLLAACAPCQPFSKQNRQKRPDDARADLLGEVVRFVGGLEPDFILIENVPAIRQQDRPDEGPLHSFLERIGRLGYHSVAETVQVADYGVPQHRPRLVVLASRLGPISLPAPTHGAGRRPYATVRDAIAHLPAIPAGGECPSVANHRASGLSETNLRRIRATPPGADRRSWSKDLRLACHEGVDGYTDVYGRMCWDRPAPALTTRCNSLSNGRFGHPQQDRAVSAREAAALQSFPDDFAFVGSMEAVARQIGNAVPPLLARRLAEAFLPLRQA